MAFDLRQEVQSSLGNAYRVSREIGGGGMSRIFIADDETLGHRVVVKVLPPDLAGGVNLERFKREIQFAAQLHHPNIVPVLAAEQTSNLLYYTMPLIGGETLRARLDRDRRLPLDDAVRCLRDVASALGHAHARNIAHRDVKPENILTDQGRSYVTDFGIARAIECASEMESITSTGFTLGTPTYMSPEQAAAEKHIDGRSDIYSLGCVFFEMLSGQPPFTARTARLLIAKHLKEKPPPVRARRPELPAHIEKALFIALAKDPADRFATAEQFADAVEQQHVTAEWPLPKFPQWWRRLLRR